MTNGIEATTGSEGVDPFGEKSLQIAEQFHQKYPNSWGLLYHNGLMPELIEFILRRDTAIEQESTKLKAHLMFMAGQYEGMTGIKSGYLIRNWPEYSVLSQPNAQKGEGNEAA